jgi:hypothetical protein
MLLFVYLCPQSLFVTGGHGSVCGLQLPRRLSRDPQHLTLVFACAKFNETSHPVVGLIVGIRSIADSVTHNFG